MSNEANVVLNEVLARLATVLGNTFSEHPRAYDLTSLDAVRLENGYSVIFGQGTPQPGIQNSGLLMLRPVTISVTYRTYSHSGDDKTKTKLATVLQKEEDIICDLRQRVLTSAWVTELISANVTTFKSDQDVFLIDEIIMGLKYKVLSG